MYSSLAYSLSLAAAVDVHSSIRRRRCYAVFYPHLKCEEAPVSWWNLLFLSPSLVTVLDKICLS
jgi:hypothetical protein